MTDKKDKCITIILMVVLGTCMHFVLDVIPSGSVAVFLGNIFPVNETSWEHMKMIWYPFLVAGTIHSVRKKDRGYFVAFVVCAVIAMLLQLGAFSVYQSFTGTSTIINFYLVRCRTSSITSIIRNNNRTCIICL